MMYTKDHLIKDMEQLIPKGFTVKHFFGSIQFERIEKDRQLAISIGYNQYPGSFYPKGMGASIKFHDVEDILNPILEKNQIQRNIENRTIHLNLKNIKEVNYSRFETEIHDEESFQVVAVEIKKIITKGAMPFFEKYNTLSTVADLLANKEPQEAVPYIQGAILFPKTILILKLANHPSFQTQMYLYYEALKQYAEKKEVYKQMLLVFENLFSNDLKKP